MTTDRLAAVALIAGSLAGLLVMALHPTGAEVSRDIAMGDGVLLVSAVHWLGIVAQPVIVAGTVALTLRLRRRRDVGVGALVFFCLASMAVLIAAAASGLISPEVLRGMRGAEATAEAERDALHYTWLLNQAFASVYVVLAAIAVALWSWAILAGRELPRLLGWFGLAIGTALLAGRASGHLHLDIHGFGLVMILLSAWLIWTAAALWRGAAPGEAPPA